MWRGARSRRAAATAAAFAVVLRLLLAQRLADTAGLPNADRQGVYEPQELSGSDVLAKLAKRAAPPLGQAARLREIGESGVIVLKDFRSVLSMRRDARAAVLAALRELFDGSWTRLIGSDGGRRLHCEAASACSPAQPQSSTSTTP